MNEALRELDGVLVQQRDKIEDLLSYHRNQVICPVYTSVDIRRNNHKAAVVDANAFPAGFNNLATASHNQASKAIASYISKLYPEAKDVLIVAENHTRNKWYFQNLYALQRLFAGAGFNVTLGTMNEELFPQATMETALGDTIQLHGVLREGNELIADAIVHDVVVLNNDLSTGTPDLLDGLEQPVTPSPVMGWHRRSKARHFRIVNELAAQLGAHAGFDPWLISAHFERVDDVDFKGRDGLGQVAQSVDRVLALVQERYDHYGIDRQANVFVKADAGTYGMGITTATSGTEFLAINSKGREKMDRGKERVKVDRVIVQEGVPTDMRTGEHVSEPVIYMVCGSVVGGFHRVHEGKGDSDNLNSPGSRFEPFSLDDRLSEIDRHVYQVIGEIASIATGYEELFANQPGLPLASYP